AGLYSYMYQLNNASSTFGGLHTTIYTGMSADELNRPSLPTDPFLINNIPPTESAISSMWLSCYTIIYNANAILEGLDASGNITIAMKRQLRGEALFIRAFVHFYLVNLFGDVPLVLTTDVRQTATIGRTPVASVYERIVTDLLESKSLLSEGYSNSNNERVRVNRFAASAFLARVYLYTGAWQSAIEAADAVIDNSGLYELSADLNTVFYKNSKEAVWQFYSFGGDGHTTVGAALVPASATSIPNYTMTDYLMNTFESGDQRATTWVATSTSNSQVYYRPYKYRQRVATTGATGEYDMVLRLAEQYLIRAEAKAQLNDIAGAQEDLNKIRNRAGLLNTSASDKDALLAAIEKERQVELFVEWGHRWLDLKRTRRIDAILSPIKSGWQSARQLFPLPAVELSKNPALEQNAGY
ncbi:MAG: RagB/SusD family nutrient uptake outer membrane protein, partial [Sediminibacterium sp.]